MHIWSKEDIQECKVDFIARLITSVFISSISNTWFKDIYILSRLSINNNSMLNP